MRRTWPLFLLLFAAVACSPDTHSPVREINERLLDEPSVVFHRQDILRWEEVQSWTFQSHQDVGLWQRQGFDLASRLNRDHWFFGASKLGAFIEHTVTFHSDSIDRLEVHLEGMRRRPLTLQWTQPGSPYSDQYSLEAKDLDKDGLYVFDLAEHPRWQGNISGLRLLPNTLPKLRGRLYSVRALRGAVEPQRLDRFTQETFKIPLGQTHRTARLVVPESPWVRRISVAENQRLDGFFGIDSDARREVSFRITAVDATGTESTIFDASVKPLRVTAEAAAEANESSSTMPHLPAGRWHAAQLDLSPWEGQELELRFQTASPPVASGTDPDGTIFGFWGDLRLSRPRQEPPPPNVILVVIDTLRADHLSRYGYHRPTSPNLDRWAEAEAVTFLSTIAPSPWTFPSHLSLFTGLDPLTHGQLYSHRLPQRFDLLAEQLQEAGYETMAITGGGFMDAHYGFAQGFDRYHVVPGRLSPNGDLEEGLRQARLWTQDAEHPYFLFFHTYEVHSPFRARQPFHRQLSGREGNPERLSRLVYRKLPLGDTAGAIRRKSFAWVNGTGAKNPLREGEEHHVVDAYDSAIAYTDHHLGSFLQDLSSDRRSKPVVIVTSDHGEALGEEGLAGHAYLYDINLEVPLLIALPDGRGAGRQVESQVRLIDVAPTLLQALDLPRPPMDGVSLLPYFEEDAPERSPEDEIAWSATAFEGFSLRRSNRLKYIFNPTLWKRQEAKEALFLLDRDPDERHNLAPDHASTDSLRELATRRYMASLNGLQLSLHNNSDQDAQIAMEVPGWVGPQFITSLDAPAEAIEVEKRGQLSVHVEADEHFSVLLAQVAPNDPIAVEVQGKAGSCRLPLDAATGALSAPSETTLRDSPRRFDGRCREISDDDPEGLSLTLHYLHPESPSDTGKRSQDPLPSALADQLRALGYLD